MEKIQMLHPRMCEIAVETKAYRDLDKTVILTSGEIGIYFINAENFVQDGGEFNKYGDDSAQMISHANRMVLEHPTFKEAIEILVDATEKAFPSHIERIRRAVSGGQRRDWLFSGPVASMLGYDHISVYKDGSLYRLTGAMRTQECSGLYSVHIADLLTVGSSIYDVRANPPTGWVPALRNAGAEVRDVVVVVTRCQGGEENLANVGLNTTSFVPINEDFLRAHSKNLV
jgi:orotate phosphoribosyltransferase